MAAAKVATPAKQTSFNGLARIPFGKAQKSFAQRTVSNGIKTRQMLVWQPTNNKCVRALSSAGIALERGCVLLSGRLLLSYTDLWLPNLP